MSKSLITLIILVAVLVGVFLFVGKYINLSVEQKLETTTLTIDTQLAEQELLLSSVADLTRQLGADEITEQIVVDCVPVERLRFDQLLNQLSGSITRAELEELDVLFYKCGSYYADRKLVMAARLLREVDTYKNYLSLRANVVGDDSQNLERLANWQQVADMEMKAASYFNDLVDLQGDIILTLLAGKSRTSPEITTTLESVTVIRNEMTVLAQQIEKIRAELRPI
jgi:hypothetical protein